MKSPNSIKDISKGDGPLARVDITDQIPLPPPYDKLNEEPQIDPLDEKVAEDMVCLDDTVVVNIPKPKTKEEEEKLVNLFLSGVRKSVTAENNWTFLQQLTMSFEHCAK